LSSLHSASVLLSALGSSSPSCLETTSSWGAHHNTFIGYNSLYNDRWCKERRWIYSIQYSLWHIWECSTNGPVNVRSTNYGLLRGSIAFTKQKQSINQSINQSMSHFINAINPQTGYWSVFRYKIIQLKFDLTVIKELKEIKRNPSGQFLCTKKFLVTAWKRAGKWHDEWWRVDYSIFELISIESTTGTFFTKGWCSDRFRFCCMEGRWEFQGGAEFQGGKFMYSLIFPLRGVPTFLTEGGVELDPPLWWQFFLEKIISFKTFCFYAIGYM